MCRGQIMQFALFSVSFAVFRMKFRSGVSSMGEAKAGFLQLLLYGEFLSRFSALGVFCFGSLSIGFLPPLPLYEKKVRYFLQNNYKILTSRPKSVFRRVCCIFHKPPCISARNRLCLKQRNRSLSFCGASSIVFAFLMVAARFLFSAKEEQIL